MHNFYAREPSGRIRGPHAPRDLGSVLTLDHRNVILALQIEPELRTVSKIAAEPNRRISGDGPASVEYVGDTA